MHCDALGSRIREAHRPCAERRSPPAGDDIEKELVNYGERNDVDAVFLNADDSPSPLKIDIIRGVPVSMMIVPASL